MLFLLTHVNNAVSVSLLVETHARVLLVLSLSVCLSILVSVCVSLSRYTNSLQFLSTRTQITNSKQICPLYKTYNFHT